METLNLLIEHYKENLQKNINYSLSSGETWFKEFILSCTRYYMHKNGVESYDILNMFGEHFKDNLDLNMKYGVDRWTALYLLLKKGETEV